jgi:signal transduction histidine kinase
LQDQTNREGFRDTPEKHALVRMLRHVIITECRTFLEDVSDTTKPLDKDELDNIERRLETSQREAVRRIRDIGKKVPEEKQTVDQLLDYLKDVTLAWERAKEVAQTFESELEKYIHLAGVGLMVEFIAHELTRATQNALSAIDTKKGQPVANIEVLRAQLKTIEKRLRILDPVSIPGRQRRSNQDIRPIIEDVLEAHQAQFDRHDIKVKREPTSSRPLEARVEKGQIIQIMENLVANSVYWLREKAARQEYSPSIRIRLDPAKRQIHFSDNGPGIPGSRTEDIFRPFFTTKPPGKGRGLGLYIARKLAEYNDATLELEEADGTGIHRGFVLRFKDAKG